MVQQVPEQLHQALAGRYRFHGQIGSGGTATVYLADDLRHGRQVAVKVLRPELAALLGPERFLREIRTTAGLTHPNILPLHDSGDAGGLLYYVMPYAEGETLGVRLQREGPLPLEEALRVAGEIAGALQYAHRERVIHRDVKPDNILLVDGHALVADFGLAKALEEAVEEGERTQQGLIVGTPEYMSPEQASGDLGVDARTDVYALGCVLHEMLTGRPPFEGPAPQVVLARQRSDPPPSVRTARPDVPAGIERALRQALAKRPADRFQSASEFHAALTAGLAPRRALPLGLVLAVGVGAVLASLAIGRMLRPGRAPLDPDKVVVYPLVERGSGIRAGIGQEIALMIGSALEHTDPLKWIDGWTWLDAMSRRDVSTLQSREARTIAKERGARYYVDGVALTSADSARVVLRLNDVLGDSVIAQATTSGPADSTAMPQLGLRAINLLLPRLLEPGRRLELMSLVSRRPAAIADWLQGEREYRRSRYARALEYQRRAVAIDSALAFAALKGALAAEWEHQYDEAALLVNLALRNDSILPPRYVHFARGMRAYYAGDGDSAARHFEAALSLDSTWAEAWMALGEVRYHLAAQADSAAADAFARARAADPDFAPPLFHLTEIALREHRLSAAERLIRDFRRTDPDSLWLFQLEITLDCLQRGPQAVNWRAAAAAHPLEVLWAAKVAGAHGTGADCAEAGFQSVFSSPASSPSARWGAALGLQGVLTARGRLTAVGQVLDSSVATGLPAANGLYVVHAAAGHGLDAKAAAVIRDLGTGYERQPRHLLWYQGLWLTHRRDLPALHRVAGALERLAHDSATTLNRFTSAAIRARLALLQGDTGQAISLLRGLNPSGDVVAIDWGVPESFGAEALLLAQLLLARGDAAGAIEAATRLEDPRPISYLMYLRQSLSVRATAAERLGRQDQAIYRERLRRLLSDSTRSRLMSP